ncbi:MAG TPA: Eco57I restriction-modification methylase domain-containing protein [Saprospiraceae bacterium]|nr:Eco57I restriction-modification methylase domain-containing protein [Saprospiraceae bacterium]
MKLLAQTISKTLQPAYRAQNVERGKLERFRSELSILLEHLDHSAAESEEHLKNIVSDFLKAAFYREEHFVNTKDRQDLVIHNGRTAKDSVGVIIETKKPGNKSEMISPDKPNGKALHELLRYYLNERSGGENKEIRHLVINNIHTWYIFDAADFERHIYANQKLLKQYADWKEGRMGTGITDWFYREIAAPFFEKELPELRCCTFDLRDYATAATNQDPNDDELLLDLYKILSPQHLLKKAFANDSNALNKQFYDELLYILGLEEVKEGGKKIIDRASKRRCEGSLLENTLSELEVSGVWRDATGLDQFGDTPEYQRFSIALELCITWLNRILFLKLLEGQLLRWRGGSERLLTVERVKDYDELNELFFHVLAVPEGERRESVQKKFHNIPYLNSSLFEQTELERRTLRVSSLSDRLTMPVLPNSVLQQNANAPKEMTTLAYLFAFLDAYDFSSDAKARIQAENRAVINASVLGLIFEKINGYRDGSFFTPGFITMYMCRETLRRAVLQKFNERFGWDCANVETDLHNELIRHKTPIKEANAIINHLRICDPAVGSGHFLVSALNELIAIKSDLGILCDADGKLLTINAVVGNDELILTDANTDQPIEYQPGNTSSQRIQEALFTEKQTLIENCLFGVDINPKSVMICRLRLWIELLKHAYFTSESKYQRLETLPNIDINIKSGNSLVSRFALDEDLSDVFKKQKFSHADYLLAVQAYKNVRTKDGKEELRTFIQKIKDEFRQAVFNRNPFNKALSPKRGQLVLLDNNLDLFGEAKKDPETIKKEKAKLNAEIAELERKLEEYKSGPLYRNSFEWRFEFPEVLDDKGEYVGFDVVLGNPPYIRQEELAAFKPHFQTVFETFAGTADLYVYFVERGMNILRPGGQFSYILPNKWMRAGYGDKLRQFVKRQRIEGISDFGDLPVFEEATTYPCIFEMSRAEARPVFPAVTVNTLTYERSLSEYIRSNAFSVSLESLSNSGWTLSNQGVQQLLDKLRAAGTPLGEYVQGKIYYGIKTGLNEAFVIDAATRDRLIAEDARSAEVIKPFLSGKEIKKFQNLHKTEQFILFIPWHFPLHQDVNISGSSEIAESEFQKRYSSVYQYLLKFRTQLEKRNVAETGIRYEWYALQRCAASYFTEFEEMKIVWPETSNENQFCYVDKGIYLNKTTFFCPIKDHSLLGILNSKVIKFCLSAIVSKMRGGYFSMSKAYVETVPIPKISNGKLQLDNLVSRILAAKQSDPQADTTALEAEIDALVYGLYGLTEEEIAIVEGG